MILLVFFIASLSTTATTTKKKLQVLDFEKMYIFINIVSFEAYCVMTCENFFLCVNIQLDIISFFSVLKAIPVKSFFYLAFMTNPLGIYIYKYVCIHMYVFNVYIVLLKYDGIL